MAKPHMESRPSAFADLSRRSFLVSSFGGVAAFGFARGAHAATDLPMRGEGVAAFGGEAFSPTIWYAIDAQGLVSVNVAKAEMGQHIGTALARIVADELEAPWKDVRIVEVDYDPKWGLMMTGGSTSVAESWPVMSRAGAAGRIVLIEAAARLSGASPDQCSAREGAVQTPAGKMTYAEIIQKGDLKRTFSKEELEKIPLKAPNERRMIGKPLTALDIPSKTNGTAIYGIDARAPGMVYARPLLPPTRYGASITSIDDSEAKKVKGYIQTLKIDDPSGTIPGWALVIAENYPAAIKAADRVKVAYTAGKGELVSEQQMLDHGRALISDPKGGVIWDSGDYDTGPAFAKAARVFEQSYTTATVLHAPMEPLNAMALEKDGVVEVHAGCQAQSLVVPILAKALNRPKEKIALPTYLLGGGFGRRLNGDYMVAAAIATVKLGKPVKVVFTRPDDFKFDSPRTCSVQTLRVALDANNKIIGQEHDACAGWPTEAMGLKQGMKKGVGGQKYDPFAIDGANHWYDIRPLKVRAIRNDLIEDTIFPGWLRSVGPGWTNFALESFMDELAHQLGQDPVQFRLGLLNGKGGNAGSAPKAVGGALRQANVVRRCVARANWGAPLPANVGLGFATTFGQERDSPTWLACVARVIVDPQTGAVGVEKLTIEADAGAIIDLDGAKAQMTGAAYWGVSMALYEGANIKKGVPAERNFDQYKPMRIYQAPEIDLAFVESSEHPTGLGEPGTTVVAPAIANAIHAAVGVRMRHLPMRPEDVKAAIKQASKK